MKKFKFPVLLLAIAVTVILAAPSAPVFADDTPTDGPAAEGTGQDGDTGESTDDPLKDYSIEYGAFRISCRKGVYFQFVKKEQPGKLKANAWIPATVSGDRAYIDFSDITKTTYVALTFDPTATAADSVITLECPVKSLKATVNYLCEAPKNLFEALSLIEVKTAAGTTETLKSSDTEAQATEFKNKFGFQWKRGANGLWNSAATDDDENFALDFRMLCATSATLYVRVNETAKDGSLHGIIPSKEAKVKIGKTAAAPNVKQDYKRGSLAIKNGMEFKYGDKTFFVPAFDKKSKTAAKISSSSGSVNSKVSYVGLEELFTVLKEEDNEVSPGSHITLYVRMSATIKKHASLYAVVPFVFGIPAPEDEITVKYEFCEAKGTLRAAFSVSGEPVEGRGIQYAVGGEDADISQLKFTELKKTDGDYLPVGFDARVGKLCEYVNSNGAKDKTKKGEELYLFVRYSPITTKNSEKHPGFCARYRAKAVEDTTITLPTEENKPPYTISFITTVTNNDINGGGATVYIGEEAVLRTTTNGEAVKFKVTPTVVKKDDKDRKVELVVKLSGKVLTADKDGFYSTGAVAKGGVVMIDITYGDPEPEPSGTPTPTP